MFKFLRALLVVLLAVSFICPPEAAASRHHHHHSKHRHHRYHLTARSAILWDPANNRTYFNLHPGRRVYAASTTKLITLMLVLDHLSLDQYVTAHQDAAVMPPTKINLKAGEQFTVRDLLYSLMLKSANDAAVALADAVAGSQAKFVVMMNAKARQLGAVHSRFSNTNGLPGGKQYTTAADMAKIFNAALKYGFFRQVITYKYHIIYSKQGRRVFLKAHNKLLFSNWKEKVYGKTGYTREARSCFVGYLRHGKGILIVAVYGCSRRWTDIKYIIEHYAHIRL